IVEECFQERIEGAPSHAFAGDPRRVDVARAVALVAHMALPLENGQQRADGGGAWRIGNRVSDFRGGGFAEPVERLHDRALAAAEPAAFILPRVFAKSGHAKKLAPLPAAVNRARRPFSGR